jgi:hypothetical protein
MPDILLAPMAQIQQFELRLELPKQPMGIGDVWLY